jgi:hypothetical protein
MTKKVYGNYGVSTRHLTYTLKEFEEQEREREQKQI